MNSGIYTCIGFPWLDEPHDGPMMAPWPHDGPMMAPSVQAQLPGFKHLPIEPATPGTPGILGTPACASDEWILNQHQPQNTPGFPEGDVLFFKWEIH